MRALADASEFWLPAGGHLITELKQSAEALARSSSPGPAIVGALSDLAEALQAKSAPPRRADEFEASVETLRRALDSLEAEEAPSARFASLDAALRAATDGLYLGRDADPPFGEPVQEEPLSTLPDEMAQARADVLALARVNWTHTRRATARALGSLADVLEAADAKGTQRPRIAALRETAVRLGDATAVTFGQSQWVKAGLTTALDGLEELLSRQAAGPWVSAARAAVANIEVRDSLSFQRAPVQDAFRATLDAFTAASPPP